MRKLLLLIGFVFFAINGYSQDIGLHYIKFLHIGEKLVPVRTLSVSYLSGDIQRDSTEMAIDSLPVKAVVTDEASYRDLLHYIKKANFKIGGRHGKLEFGTFKITDEGQYFFLPDFSVTAYFKNMILYLRKKNSDPQLIDAIINNYSWIFNP